MFTTAGELRLGEVGEAVRRRRRRGDRRACPSPRCPERLAGAPALLLGSRRFAEQIERVRVVVEPAHVAPRGRREPSSSDAGGHRDHEHRTATKLAHRVGTPDGLPGERGSAVRRCRRSGGPPGSRGSSRALERSSAAERHADMVSAAPARNHDQRARPALERRARARRSASASSSARPFDREQHVAALAARSAPRRCLRAPRSPRKPPRVARREREAEQRSAERRRQPSRDRLCARGDLCVCAPLRMRREPRAPGPACCARGARRTRAPTRAAGRRRAVTRSPRRDARRAPPGLLATHARDERARAPRRQLERRDEAGVEILEVDAEPDRRHLAVRRSARARRGRASSIGIAKPMPCAPL